MSLTSRAEEGDIVLNAATIRASSRCAWSSAAGRIAPALGASDTMCRTRSAVNDSTLPISGHRDGVSRPNSRFKPRPYEDFHEWDTNETLPPP